MWLYSVEYSPNNELLEYELFVWNVPDARAWLMYTWYTGVQVKWSELAICDAHSNLLCGTVRSYCSIALSVSQCSDFAIEGLSPSLTLVPEGENGVFLFSFCFVKSDCLPVYASKVIKNCLTEVDETKIEKIERYSVSP